MYIRDAHFLLTSPSCSPISTRSSLRLFAQAAFFTLMDAQLERSQTQEWADLCQDKIHLPLVWGQAL